MSRMCFVMSSANCRSQNTRAFALGSFLTLLLRFCRDDGKPLSTDDWELLQSKVDELHLDIGMIDVSNNERERLESEDC